MAHPTIFWLEGEGRGAVNAVKQLLTFQDESPPQPMT